MTEQITGAVLQFSRKVYAILVVIFLVALFSGGASIYLLLHTAAEARDRRSQTCATFEGQHLQEVRQLAGTYAYLLALTPAERRSTLNRFVVKQLPELERNAHSDSDDFGVKVPAYCDAPNVGLPEPDPVAPKRPKSLRLTP